MSNSYDFPVQLQPIYLDGGIEIADRKAVVRTDTMRTLGIVSNEYELVNHASVIDAFRACGEKHGIREKVTLTNHGGNMFFEMLFPKVEAEVKVGDFVRMQLIAKNSYNGSHALQIVFGALRLVCTNGMVLPSAMYQFSYKHIGNMGGVNDSSMYRFFENMYERYATLFTERMPIITEMARKNAVDAEIVFDPKVTKLPEYLLTHARSQYHVDHDYSVWGVYNALTNAITHRMKTNNPDRAIEYGKVAWSTAEKMLTA